MILYECLAGVRPFDADNPLVLLARVVAIEPQAPSKHVPGLPRDLELITIKCLARDSADRYPTADELGDDLERFLDGEPMTVRPAGPVERTVKWVRRKPVQAAAYALTMAVVVLIGFGASLAVL